ncbi:unnamed protein product [Fusarium venenatum]|uniref:Uncharacterized protein n=2 Tax=Fusarium venenatum TaxID=56646 RepID=A0A2L2T4A9_9HYPO|nr:uncharacterized protein FVRRES_02116 [Fusarium venenatum]CEI65604.1 unnamed protein product [Fusarium venenatum]
MALSTIAEGWEWPDDSMAIDHPALELPVPAEEPPVPYVPWEELRRQEDRKLERMEESGNEASYSHLYAHLENSELDWSLEGRLALDEWYGSVAVFSPGPRFPRVPPLDNDAGAGASVMDEDSDKGHYVPSEKAIKHSLKLSILDLAISLFTFALFVNSAILIVAGASLYGDASALGADIFGIHGLLSQSISPAAGTIFALALLLSGVSAGIVCTIAGQMVSEGSLNWKVKPWLRRLMVRSISITPSIIIAGAVGRSGLNAALNGSQVVLSVILPFVTAPLIYFTARDKYMTVRDGGSHGNIVDGNGMTNDVDGEEAGIQPEGMKMANSWFTTIIAILVWLFIAVMNLANLVFLGK